MGNCKKYNPLHWLSQINTCKTKIERNNNPDLATLHKYEVVLTYKYMYSYKNGRRTNLNECEHII